jgi:hypothetical protein
MPVTANKYDIVIEQGATFTLAITYKDSSGSLIDLTNYDARMEVRASYDASSALITLTSEVSGTGNTSGIALGGAAGTINVVISETTTKALTAPATNVYDLELVAPDGSITRLIEGKATVSPGVTQSTYGE